MNSKISWNLLQFPENEEGHSVLVRSVTVHNLHNINALLEIIVHNLGVGPSTK